MPPASVELRLTDHVLVVKGLASEEWIAGVKSANAALLNVDRINLSAVKVDYSAQLKPLLEQLQSTKIYFAEKLQLTAPSHAELSKVSQMITQAQKLAASTGERLKIVLVGQADASGTDNINSALKIERSSVVKTALVEFGVPAQILALESGQDPGAKKENSRRVDLKIKLLQ